VRQVLNTALAWAVMNNHFEIADLSSCARGPICQHELEFP